jgi:molybdate transport system substrate-binding protein
MSRHIVRTAAIAALLIARASFANADDLTVFSTIGVQSALESLTPQLEKAIGHRLKISWGTAAMLVKRVKAGESADVYVLTRQSLDTLAKDGKVAAGSQATFASSGIAVAVKKGGAKPDISTPEAFKHALLAAKAIAYSNPAAGGASGVHIAKQIEKAGLAEQLKAKTRHPPAGGNAAKLLISGEAELAIQQKPEVMSVEGVEVVGLAPGEFGNTTQYSAGAAVGSKQGEAAAALVKMLSSPEAQAVFKAKGLDPA